MSRIIVQNNTEIPNKYIRYTKWKIYGLLRRFSELHYTEIYLNREGDKPTMYYAVIKLGIPGKDIVIKNHSSQISKLLKKSMEDAFRYLSKWKRKQQHK